MPTSASPTSAPFAATLGQAIAHHGKPLSELARILTADGVAISTATLSAWQRGSYAPRQDQYRVGRILALERVLSLPMGRLLLLLDDGPRAPHRAPVRAARSGATTGPSGVKRMVDGKV